MTLQSTSTVDERLAEIVGEVESQEVGLRVVAARVYRLPCVNMQVDLLVQIPRRFNVLEEFVLRAACELDPHPTRSELAFLLGLDDLFVRATCQSLEQLEAIKVVSQDRLELTSLGQEFYQQGRIPRAPERKPIKLAYLSVIDEVTAWEPPETNDSVPVLPGLSDQKVNELETSALASVTLQRVIDCAASAGLDWHSPGEGRTIMGIENMAIATRGDCPYGVLVVQDTAVIGRQADNVFLRAFNLGLNSRDIALEQILERWLEEGRAKLGEFMPAQVGFKTLFGPPSKAVEAEKPAHAQLVEQLYHEQTTVAREREMAQAAPASQGMVELLRDEAIWPRFMQVLEQTRHTLLIISPWITAEVVDREFKKRLSELAQRGAIVVMGWGIARDCSQEERAPSQSLLESLRAIRTPDGAPAVLVWWLGNQHRKDVLSDYAVYMMGSHNWLSYRGDRLPRGETTFYATQAELIHQAADYIGPLFAQAASLEWDQISSSPKADQSELERCCVTWVAVRKPEEATARVLDFARDDPALVPTAFELMRVVCSALAYLPPDELMGMQVLDLMERVVPELVTLAQSASEPDSSSSGFLKSLKRLLSRYAEKHGPNLVRFLEGQRNVWEDIGLVIPGEKAAAAINRLAGEGVRAAKSKKGGRR